MELLRVRVLGDHSVELADADPEALDVFFDQTLKQRFESLVDVRLFQRVFLLCAVENRAVLLGKILHLPLELRAVEVKVAPARSHHIIKNRARVCRVVAACFCAEPSTHTLRMISGREALGSPL